MEISEEFEDMKEQKNMETATEKIRYLTFELDGLSIGVSTGYVTEIINNHTITFLPMVPEYISGIINLRGQIMPIIDIRLRMGKTPAEYTNKSCIIILNIDTVFLGIIVDSVQQVIDIDSEKISAVPAQNRQELINGMITTDDKKVLLFLDCEELVRSC